MTETASECLVRVRVAINDPTARANRYSPKPRPPSKLEKTENRSRFSGTDH